MKRIIDINSDIFENRNRSIDVARGIATVLVILSHIQIDLLANHLKLYNGLSTFYYQLHVPTFLFVSGMMTHNQIKRHTHRNYFILIADSFGIMLVWGILLLPLFIVLGNSFIASVWIVGNALWFFIPYGIARIINFAIHNYPSKRSVLLPVAWCVFAMAACFVNTIVAKVLIYSFIAHLGYILVDRYKKRIVAKTALYIALAFAMILSDKFIISDYTNSPGIELLFALSILFLSCQILPGIMSRFAIKNRVFERFGRYSLYYYILQIPCIAIYNKLGNFSVQYAVICFASVLIISEMFIYLSKKCIGVAILFKPSNGMAS